MPKPKTAPTSEDQRDRLRTLGFELRPLDNGRWQVQRGDCAAVLEDTTEGTRIVEGPGFLIRGEFFHLEDGGYQKFLRSATRKMPATAQHLFELHAFEERLREALGLDSLYNESLGTVSKRYRYDRLGGRPDAGPARRPTRS